MYDRMAALELLRKAATDGDLDFLLMNMTPKRLVDVVFRLHDGQHVIDEELPALPGVAERIVREFAISMCTETGDRCVRPDLAERFGGPRARRP